MKNLLLSVLLLLPLISLAGKTYTVTVVVKSLDGLKPLKGVTVNYRDKKDNIIFTEVTNEEGKVTFSNCKENYFDILCTSPEKIYKTGTDFFYNKNNWDIDATIALRYETETENEFVTAKMAPKYIDTTLHTPDTCLTLTDAEFPGGKEAMVDFLRANIIVPLIAEELSIKGKVYLKFILHADGSMSYIQVVKGIPDCPECDAEALRVMAYMPNWSPSLCDGIPVNCWYTLPIIFNVF